VTVELTSADAGGEHALGVGQEVLLRLPENRTTGYAWQLAVPDGVTVADDGYQPAASGAPGAGGVRVFRLRPTVPGAHRVTAALRRSWEPPDAPAADALEFALRAADRPLSAGPGAGEDPGDDV
jgi:predicted secreted protein